MDHPVVGEQNAKKSLLVSVKNRAMQVVYVQLTNIYIGIKLTTSSKIKQKTIHNVLNF